MHDSGNAQQVCHRQAPMLRSFLTRLRLGMGTGSSHPSSPLQSLARWLLNLVRLHPSARFESRSRCKSGQLVRSGGRCCVVQTANPATPLSNMPSILDFNRCIFRGSILWRWWGQVKDRTHTFIRSGILDSFFQRFVVQRLLGGSPAREPQALGTALRATNGRSQGRRRIDVQTTGPYLA